MAFKLTFTDPVTGAIYNNAYIVPDGYHIETPPSGERFEVRCRIFVSKEAYQANCQPLPTMLKLRAKQATFNAVLKVNPADPNLNIFRIIKKAFNAWVKSLDPVNNIADREFFDGIQISFVNAIED